MTKQEELKELASKVDLIFKGREKKKISYFILSYAQLLKKIYQYQILLNTLQKYSEDYHKTLEQAQKAVNEMHYRKELLEAYTNLKESYLQVEKSNSLEKLKKQIQL